MAQELQSKSFRYPATILETYLDTMGHMNNAKYLTLYEEARWDLITKNGYGLEKVKSTGQAPTILEVNLRYLKELRLRDEIVIHTQTVSYEKKIGQLEQKMLRGSEVCSTATFTFALFDLSERKLILPTTAWLQAIGIA